MYIPNPIKEYLIFPYLVESIKETKKLPKEKAKRVEKINDTKELENKSIFVNKQ